MKIFMPETIDKMGGKSTDDDMPTNKINANNANPNSNGNCAAGHRWQTKLSMKKPLQHLTQPKTELS